MKHAAAALALGWGLCLVCLGASSQVVYRCGNSYSQAPCPHATIVDASDPRSATQRAEARTVAAQQHQLANAMAHERRVRERQVPRRASGFDSRTTRPATAASAHEPRKPRKKHRSSAHRSRQGADFIAIVPGSGKKPARPPA